MIHPVIGYEMFPIIFLPIMWFAILYYLIFVQKLSFIEFYPNLPVPAGRKIGRKDKEAQQLMAIVAISGIQLMAMVTLRFAFPDWFMQNFWGTPAFWVINFVLVPFLVIARARWHVTKLTWVSYFFLGCIIILGISTFGSCSTKGGGEDKEVILSPEPKSWVKVRYQLDQDSWTEIGPLGKTDGTFWWDNGVTIVRYENGTMIQVNKYPDGTVIHTDMNSGQTLASMPFNPGKYFYLQAGDSNVREATFSYIGTKSAY
jgi:hypothetical protein